MIGVRPLCFALTVLSVAESAVEVANAYSAPIFVKVDIDRVSLAKAYAAASLTGWGWGAIAGTDLGYRQAVSSDGFATIQRQKSLALTPKGPGLVFLSIFTIDKYGTKIKIEENISLTDGQKVIVDKQGHIKHARSTWVDKHFINHQEARITVANAYASPILVFVNADFAKLLSAARLVKENAITLGGGDEGFTPIKSKESFVFEIKHTGTLYISILALENGKMKYLVYSSLISPNRGVIVNKNGGIVPARDGMIWADEHGINHRN